MPTSRNRKKTTGKKIKKPNNQRRIITMSENQMPPVVNAPIWKQDAKIEMNGLEFEQIYNFINNAQGAAAALHSIMQKNLLNGTIKMSFRKLNEDATEYVAMTDEEQAPHIQEFEGMLQQARDIAEQAVGLRAAPVAEEDGLFGSQEGVPNLNDIVDPTGQPAQTGLVDTAGNPLKAV